MTARANPFVSKRLASRPDGIQGEWERSGPARSSGTSGAACVRLGALRFAQVGTKRGTKSGSVVAQRTSRPPRQRSGEKSQSERSFDGRQRGSSSWTIATTPPPFERISRGLIPIGCAVMAFLRGLRPPGATWTAILVVAFGVVQGAKEWDWPRASWWVRAALARPRTWLWPP